jgi:hypothetical protein
MNKHQSVMRGSKEWVFKCGNKCVLVNTNRFEDIIYCPLCNANIKLIIYNRMLKEKV